MKKILLAGILFFSVSQSFAQIQVMKIVGKEAKDYLFGFGALLKFGISVSEASTVSLEAGANFFMQKEDKEEGMAIIPAKISYRHTLNGSGTGVYLEPAAGYNLYGVKSVYNGYNYDDVKFHGIIGGLGLGYLFQPGNKIQFNLGAYYESVFYKGGPTSYIGLRLVNSFSNRRSD